MSEADAVSPVSSIATMRSMTPTAIPMASTPGRVVHRRVRSMNKKSKGSFYGQERPIFICGKAVTNEQIALPKLTNSYVLHSNGEIERKMTGQSFDDNSDPLVLEKMSSSKTFIVSTAQTIGKRVYMEDVIYVQGEYEEGVDVYAVFDGHNGKEAAIEACKHLKECLGSLKDVVIEDINDKLNDSFNKLQEIICSKCESGTTCSLVIIKDDTLIIANVGDSPIIAVNTLNNVMRLGEKHTTSNEKEIEHVMERGGVVEDVNGVKRVNGVINITRSLGDKAFHPPMDHLPFIQVLNKDDYKRIVIASDGIDTVQDELLEFYLREGETAIVSQAIRNKAYELNSKDNISVIVISTY